jgi:acyl-CoA dehydrogenase
MSTEALATPAGQELLQGLRDFLARESPPEVVRRQDEDKKPPLTLLRKLGDLGYLALGLPEQWGGAGDMHDVTLMMEDLGRANLGLGHLAGRTMYGLQLLIHFGTREQQEVWIPKLRSGECVFSIGLSEPDAGSDAAAIRNRARAVEAGGWIIDGNKVFSSSMGYAGLAMVAARTDTDSEKHAGITTFLVDPKSPGIDCTLMPTIGDWSVGTYQVLYSGVRVPQGAILGELNQGWKVITGHLARERLTMAARAVGATRDVLDLATDHALRREQFGHPLADFQAIQHKLASIRIDYQVARAALHELARDVVAGRADVTDAAAVKVFASEVWVRAAAEGMQIFGGLGYTYDAAMQRHFRDSRLYVVGGGSSEVMRNLIARAMLRSRKDTR